MNLIAQDYRENPTHLSVFQKNSKLIRVRVRVIKNKMDHDDKQAYLKITLIIRR